jgi:hypothetical protein
MICEDIISGMEKELDDMLAGAPKHLSESAKEGIKEEFINYTKHVLAALTREELQSTSACERFIQTTMAEARMRMHGG